MNTQLVFEWWKWNDCLGYIVYKWVGYFKIYAAISNYKAVNRAKRFSLKPSSVCISLYIFICTFQLKSQCTHRDTQTQLMWNIFGFDFVFKWSNLKYISAINSSPETYPNTHRERARDKWYSISVQAGEGTFVNVWVDRWFFFLFFYLKAVSIVIPMHLIYTKWFK